MKVHELLNKYDGDCRVIIFDEHTMKETKYQHKESAIRSYGYNHVINWNADDYGCINIRIRSQF